MDIASLSLPVIGAAYATDRARSRQREIAICQPGEAVRFRRERVAQEGKRLVGVYSPRGVQIGYVHADSADRVAGQIAVARAIFQAADTFGAVIHVTFDGSAPTLPNPLRPPMRRRVQPTPELSDDFCGIF